MPVLIVSQELLVHTVCIEMSHGDKSRKFIFCFVLMGALDMAAMESKKS